MTHIDMEGYLFGEQSAAERAAAEGHLGSCAACRAEVEELRQLEGLLGEAPAELLLDGPPEGADLLLARTLAQVRRERDGAAGPTGSGAGLGAGAGAGVGGGASTDAGQRRFALLAAAAVVAVVALGVGVLVGRGPLADGESVAGPTTTVEAPGTRTLDARADGVELVAQVTPAAGWVRLSATVVGLPAGEECFLVVVGQDGRREVAGGWLVSEQGSREGTTLAGSALVPPDEVAAVLVENRAGREFVRAVV